uniref:UBC core domain-containing protein n=1 Tax=Aegilops tauschii subsp. strangulata TaxID=200361 RepID=A0A453PFE6_AEGTS
PDGSPYAGGTFPVDVAIPKKYPMKPLKITFKTKGVPSQHRAGGEDGPGHLRGVVEPGDHDKHGPPVRRLRPLRPPARPPRPPRRRPAVQAPAGSLRAEGQALDPQIRLGAGRLLLSGSGKEGAAGGGGDYWGSGTSSFLWSGEMAFLRGSSPCHLVHEFGRTFTAMKFVHHKNYWSSNFDRVGCLFYFAG